MEGKSPYKHVEMRTVRRYQTPSIEEGQMALRSKDKRTNNDQQTNTEKTNEGATRTLLKIGNALVGLAGPAPDEIVLDPSIRK
jgi:hypothetical protein